MRKHTDKEANGWMLPETVAEFEAVNWNFGPMIHFPAFAYLGHPNGRVNLKDLKPDYAAKLVDGGFPHLRRRQVLPEPPKGEITEATSETAETVSEIVPKQPKKKN